MRALPGMASRTPPGPVPVPRSQLAADQRHRILRATTELIAKRGYHATTVELIIRRAKVGYGTFYKNFESKEEAFLALIDAAAERTLATIGEVFEAEPGEWPQKVAAALRLLFELIADEPVIARACLVESLSATPALVARYEAMLRRFVPMMRPGRDFNPRGQGLPASLEDTLAGGVLWIAYQRLVRGEAELLSALLPEALEFVLTPYLGEEHAVKNANTLAANAL